MPYIRVRPEGLQRMSEMLDRVEKDIEQRELMNQVSYVFQKSGLAGKTGRRH